MRYTSTRRRLCIVPAAFVLMLFIGASQNLFSNVHLRCGHHRSDRAFELATFFISQRHNDAILSVTHETQARPLSR
jgi:hypothetical protein